MDLSGFNYVDYIVLSIVALSVIFGFIRGFIASFLSFSGWIASIYLAYMLFPEIKPFLEPRFKNQIIVIMLGHAGLLVSFLIVFGVFNLLATTALKGMRAGLLDRLLGSAFGMIRAWFLISATFLLLAIGISIFHGIDIKKDEKSLSKSMPEWLHNAKTYDMMYSGSKIVASFIPDSIYKRFEDMYIDITNKTVDDRFIENSISKLKEVLGDKEVKLIDKSVEEQSLDKSADEMKYKKLEGLLEKYEDQKSKDGAITEDQVKRLREILNRSKKEAGDGQ